MPSALGLWAYISGKSLVPMLQLLQIPSNASVAIKMAHQEKLNNADMICHLIKVATNLVTQSCTLSNFLLSTKKCEPHIASHLIFAY